MKRKVFVSLAVLVALVASSAIGFQARPYLVKDGLRMHGWLVATAFAAGCQDDGQKAQALDVWRTARRTFAQAFMPGPVWAEAQRACRVLTVRSQKNLIVNAGETALRDCFNNNAGTECTDVISTSKFHGIGTGTVDPAEGDTGCGTELTTQYNPDNTRATGTQGTNGANVYRTVGTNTIDSGTPAVTEWCLLNVATGAGTMWSRVEFAAINLVANDSLQTTYDLTIE